MLTKAPIIAATALVAFGSSNPGVTVLAKRATNLLHARAAFRKAVLLEAEGTPANPRRAVKTGDRIVTWRFVFDNQQSHDKYKSVAVTARRGILGNPKGSTFPFLEDQLISPIPTMTLTRAVQLLDAAGYTSGFYAVTLREPNYPGVHAPEYIFALVGGKTVAVDTQTGAVKKL